MSEETYSNRWRAQNDRDTEIHIRDAPIGSVGGNGWRGTLVPNEAS